MSPSGSDVAQFSEGAEEVMSSSGTDVAVADCGCSTTGRCIGGRCGRSPEFLLKQKEEYEATQKRKKAEERAALTALKEKQQQEDDDLALYQYRHAPDKHVLREWIENPHQRPK